MYALDKFRRFLEHAEFLLETDNQALPWLLTHPRQLGKIGRWVVKISSFKFKVQHIRGSQNVVADALSRMFSQPSDAQSEQPCSVLLDFPLAFTDVLPHQLNDEELGPVIQNIKEGNLQAPYFLSKGVLCCRERKGRAPKIVLPSKLVPMVFSYYHNSPVGGHKGISKTISSIRTHFIWKGNG